MLAVSARMRYCVCEWRTSSVRLTLALQGFRVALLLKVGQRLNMVFERAPNEHGPTSTVWLNCTETSSMVTFIGYFSEHLPFTCLTRIVVSIAHVLQIKYLPEI